MITLRAPVPCPRCGRDVTGRWAADAQTCAQRCRECWHVFLATWPGFPFTAITVMVSEPGEARAAARAAVVASASAAPRARTFARADARAESGEDAGEAGNSVHADPRIQTIFTISEQVTEIPPGASFSATCNGNSGGGSPAPREQPGGHEVSAR
jgi:hypothetical protein